MHALARVIFNEDSANVFSDHLLLTSHTGISKEVASLFDFFDKNYNKPRKQSLIGFLLLLCVVKLNQMIQNEN